jgi:hypothetical protein
LPNTIPFQDGDPANDFYGVGTDAGGQFVVGELSHALAGVGGGAGGNSCPGPVFPTPNWTVASDKQGAGGGGGGGLLYIRAPRIRVAGLGRIRADGGKGASGQTTIGLNHVAGGSGGGSGGMVLLHAERIDLGAASGEALSARGGRYGQGNLPDPTAILAGGSGGPGIIQLHTTNPALGVSLPTGISLSTLSAPDAHVLLPVFP